MYIIKCKNRKSYASIIKILRKAEIKNFSKKSNFKFKLIKLS